MSTTLEDTLARAKTMIGELILQWDTEREQVAALLDRGNKMRNALITIAERSTGYEGLCTADAQDESLADDVHEMHAKLQVINVMADRALK